MTFIKCDNYGIKGTDGIELMKNLTSLSLNNNYIQTINLSNNTLLNYLKLSGNNYSSKPSRCIQLGNNCDFGYIVKFNSNGGSTITTQNTYYIKKAPLPTKSGYTFAGWYKNSNLTSLITFPFKPTGNMTLYAKWTERVLSQDEEDNEGPNKNIIIGIIVIVALAAIVCLGNSSSKTTKKN